MIFKHGMLSSTNRHKAHTHTVDYINNLNITHWGEEGCVCMCACICVQGVKAKLARLYKQLLGHTMYLSTLIGM